MPALGNSCDLRVRQMFDQRRRCFCRCHAVLACDDHLHRTSNGRCCGLAVLIIVAGFEVESALAGHEAVLEAAVVAKRDADGLEKPKAFVVLQTGQSDDALIEALKAHVKDKIGKWKYPRWIDVVDELPKTATGKIQRFKLREGN